MALEQSIAQALDTAEEVIRESKEEAKWITQEYFSDLNESANLTESTNYISYRNDELVESYTDIDSTLTSISESVKELKTREIFTLDEAAILSRTLREFDLTETEDEIDELGVFFGGKDNINIPDSDVNHFRVLVTEEGKRVAIDNYSKLRFHVTNTLEEAYKQSIRNGNIDEINEALGKLAVLRKTSEILEKMPIILKTRKDK
jgi:hypothetical protein